VALWRTCFDKRVNPIVPERANHGGGGSQDVDKALCVDEPRQLDDRLGGLHEPIHALLSLGGILDVDLKAQFLDSNQDVMVVVLRLEKDKLRTGYSVFFQLDRLFRPKSRGDREPPGFQMLPHDGDCLPQRFF